MNLIALLDYLENSIVELKFYQKIQLYLIPLLLSSFIVYHFELLTFQTKKLKENRVLEENRVIFFTFLKNFQAFANSKSVQILKTQQNENIVQIELSGSLKNILEVLYFCETYKSVNNLKTLSINIKSPDFVTLNADVEFAKYIYDFINIDFSSLKNEKPKQKEKEIAKEVINVSEFKLNAIVDREAFLNGIWVKKGDMIENFEVVHINKESVELQKNGKILIVKIWGENSEK